MAAAFWTGAALFCSGPAAAQADPVKFAVWTFGPGTFLPVGSVSAVPVGFNYTVTPATGGASTVHTFTGSVNRAYSTGLFYLLDFSDMELVRKRHSFHAGMGLFAEHGVIGFSWVEGYSRIFRVGGLLLKPGLDLHLISSGRKLIGNIDNRGVGIDVFGNQAKAQYQPDAPPDDYSPPETYDAARLKVEYGFTVVFVKPRLVIATPPLHKWVFNFECGYFLPTVPDGVLEFIQVDQAGQNGKKIGEQPIDHYGFHSGLHVALNAGIAW